MWITLLQHNLLPKRELGVKFNVVAQYGYKQVYTSTEKFYVLKVWCLKHFKYSLRILQNKNSCKNANWLLNYISDYKSSNLKPHPAPRKSSAKNNFIRSARTQDMYNVRNSFMSYSYVSNVRKINQKLHCWPASVGCPPCAWW